MINNIKVLEIEINSYCNRKCSWCPNISINRGFSENLSFESYIKVLEELRDNNFSGTISYSRYNEPFADFELLQQYTSKAKEILPNVLLVSNTNGDFLTKDKILNSNISELSIMDYDSLGFAYCINKLLSWGAAIEFVRDNNIYTTIDNIKVVYCVDWKNNAQLQDRGGFFKDDILNLSFKNNRVIRDYSCQEPNFLIPIDYNGNVMPCCNLRSDNIDHTEYILGNIINETLNEILSKEKNINLFNKIHNNIGVELPQFCQYCHKDVGRYLRENPSIYFDEIEKEEVNE